MPKCRVCGCTETNACNPSCSWVEGDLCSSCALIIEAVVEWMDVACRANLTGLVREARELHAFEAVLVEPGTKKRRPK